MMTKKKILRKVLNLVSFRKLHFLELDVNGQLS